VIMELDRDHLPSVRNPALRAYAQEYARIADDFAEGVAETGVAFDHTDHRSEARARRDALGARGTVLRNNDHSMYTGRISPACVACQKGIGSATFYISLRCHRNCFYCFNPNQEGYARDRDARRDVIAELRAMSAAGLRVEHLALTGGEPLLHPEEAVSFFRAAERLYPDAYTRLYTSGDHLDREILGRLRDARLDEIRISVRAHDSQGARRHTYDRLALAQAYIPAVLVETPVLPGTLPIMQEMLRELEQIGAFGVNLLEFCYPFAGTLEYRERGYQIKNPPYETLYDYWYAGGLPVSGSELDCLELLAFALDEGLTTGVHYCSLENKHTGQILQQNSAAAVPPYAHWSERDFFIKTAKVFGDEVRPARKAFRRSGYGGWVENRDRHYLEFHPDRIRDLTGLDLEVGLCSHVSEDRPGGPVLRELKVALTRPELFDPARDL